MVKKGGDGGLIAKIADLVRDKKITEVSDLRDESDRSGMRLVIELKRDAIPKVALNKLYKHTQMQATFGVNMVALVDNVPRTLSLKEMIHHYVGHQREVVIRRTQYQLRQAEARAHVLEGILIALDNLDAVIALIRGSANPDDARAGLIEKFELSEIQAQAILDMRLQRLTALESDKVRAEHAELLERIGELRAILGDEKRIDGVISEELAEIGERYARRAPDRDRLRRGRRRHRGHDRRPADGDLADRLRLREAAAAGDLSPAAPRRQGRHRDEPEGGRLHRAPPHLLDPRLPAVLHQPRQGLPAQGLRAARGLADGARQGAGQRAAAARRRAGDGGDPDPRLHRGQVPRVRDRARAWSRRPSSRSTTRRSAPTGSSRSRSATTTSSSRSG